MSKLYDLTLGAKVDLNEYFNFLSMLNKLDLGISIDITLQATISDQFYEYSLDRDNISCVNNGYELEVFCKTLDPIDDSRIIKMFSIHYNKDWQILFIGDDNDEIELDTLKVLFAHMINKTDKDFTKLIHVETTPELINQAIHQMFDIDSVSNSKSTIKPDLTINEVFDIIKDVVRRHQA